MTARGALSEPIPWPGGGIERCVETAQWALTQWQGTRQAFTPEYYAQLAVRRLL